jgi:hypothetical protein
VESSLGCGYHFCGLHWNLCVTLPSPSLLLLVSFNSFF